MDHDGEIMDIRSISSVDTDYYLWGRNCKILKYSEIETRKIIESYETNHSQEDIDLFWEGYHYGLEAIPDHA